MLASDRQQQIKELLLEYRHVDVNSLCSFLHVSPATIRRDLDVLEKKGILLKTYGGAVLNQEQGSGTCSEVYLNDSTDPFENAKKAVAALAANLVEDGDSIFLSGGEICVLLAKQLCVKSAVSVVTNNISAFLEMINMPGINAILTGGEATSNTGYPETIGEIAKSTISSMYFDKVFYSVDGISFKHGYSMSALDRLDILRCALGQSSDQILLADTSKFGRSHLHAIGNLTSVKKIITAVGAPNEYKEFFLQNKIALYEACME